MESLIAHGVLAVARAILALAEASLDRFGASFVENLLRWMLDHIGQLIARAPDVVPTARVVQELYGRVALVAGVLLLPAMMVALVAQLRAPHLPALGTTVARVGGWALAVSALPPLVTASERWVGAVSAAAFTAFGAVPEGALGVPGSALAQGTRTAAVVVLGLLAAVSALACYLELAARSLAIDLVVVCWPLAAIGLVVPALRPVVRRSLELLAGLVLLQLVLAITLGLGRALVDGEGGGAGGFALAGATLIVAAVLAPAVTLRLVPLAEVRLYEVTRALAGRSASVGSRTLAVAEALGAELAPHTLATVEPLPPFEGHPPPEELFERADRDPWVRSLLEAAQRPPRRRR